MPWRTLDESDVRVRPPRSSRPRTKRRPEHRDALPGLVTGVDRGRYTVLVEPDTADERTVTAVKARVLGRHRIVVGDRVHVVGDTSGTPGTLARIVRVEKRSTVLRRTADDTDAVERVIVANADQLVIVTALADPEPRTRMIDRCVVAGYDAGMDVLLCLTKADLADPEPLVSLYRPLGVDVVVTALRPDGRIEGLPRLREAVSGRTSVLVGHSGVGKSTLVNALVPGAARATGQVNVVTGRGRHTSSSAVALRLPRDDDGRSGWVIDTPGVRSFGLAHVDTEHFLTAFPDLADAAAACPKGCTHLADAPGCALDSWVEEGDLGGGAPLDRGGLGAVDSRAVRAVRLESFRRLLASRSGGDDH